MTWSEERRLDGEKQRGDQEGAHGRDDQLQEQRGETMAGCRKGAERVREGSWAPRPSAERGRGWDANLLQKRTREAPLGRLQPE
jgi:hypothetical protein